VIDYIERYAMLHKARGERKGLLGSYPMTVWAETQSSGLQISPIRDNREG
jgi:hypothetical protein